MGCWTVRKKRVDEHIDRLSRLPDDIIHRILGFIDTQSAVQTSILSNRWKAIWTTLPFLDFDWHRYTIKNKSGKAFSQSINHVLSHRNRESQVSKLKLSVPTNISDLPEKVIKYAISHNVKELDVSLQYPHRSYKLSTFTSNSIEKLKLRLCLENSSVESDCWDLPALTTLHLVHLTTAPDDSPVSCLMYLPALTTLHLDALGDYYLKLPVPVSLPRLRTLRLTGHKIPKKSWDLPALLNMELDDVLFPKHASKFFSELPSLKNLTISFPRAPEVDVYISCPQLVNLQIKNDIPMEYICLDNNSMAMVFAPKLRNFSSVGIFPITLGVSELENVNITLPKWTGVCEERHQLESYCKKFRSLFSVLGNAKILTLDSNTVQALSVVSDLLAYFPSPFCNLKYVKLPQGYKESGLSSTAKSYLLRGSPRASIVTTLPQNEVNALTVPVSLKAQNVVLEDPLATATKKLVDSEVIHKKVLTDILDTRNREEHVVDFLVDSDSARRVGTLVQGFGELVPNAQVAGSETDQVNSSRVNRNYGLWKGYEVNSDFVDLLDRIMKTYPETFEHLSGKSKKLCTAKLNLLCTLVNDFTKTSMTEVNSEMIAEYREHFADLQRSFNVNWLVNRLNFIERLQFSQPLVHELHAIDFRIGNVKSNLENLQTHTDDATSNLRDLLTLHVEKITEIEKAFGTLGATVADNDSCIGDDLLSGP